MTLILLLLALITSPPSTTIHPTTHHQRSTTMAQPIHPTGGNPPQYHPPGHGPNSTTQGRTGRDARNPMNLNQGTNPIAHMGTTTTPTEHTNRPKG